MDLDAIFGPAEADVPDDDGWIVSDDGQGHTTWLRKGCPVAFENWDYSTLGQTEEVPAWIGATVGLADWFSANRDKLPTEPFALGPGVRVLDPERFYEALSRDIAQGRSGPRWRLGGLFADLVALRDLCDGTSS